MEEFDNSHKGWTRCVICDTPYWIDKRLKYQDICRACGGAITRQRKWADWDAHPERIYSRDVHELLEYFESRCPKLAAELLAVDNDPYPLYFRVYREERDEE
jgi:hypothetical protein